MLVDQIVCKGVEKVETLDMVTEELIVFNLEQIEDGTIIDGRFSIPKYISFLDSSAQPLDWDFLVSRSCFKWNNQEFEIKTCLDPEISDQLELIVSQLPLFQDLEKN